MNTCSCDELKTEILVQSDLDELLHVANDRRLGPLPWRSVFTKMGRFESPIDSLLANPPCKLNGLLPFQLDT